VRFRFYLLLLIGIANVLKGSNQPRVLKGYAQGSTFQISYYGQPKKAIDQAIITLLSQIDSSVSTYQAHSIISKINAGQYGVKTDTIFRACFRKAKAIWTSSNGAFDPTVMPLVNAWGFGQKTSKKPSQGLLDSLLPAIGFNLIELNADTIIKHHPNVSLDFNAFAQGYSVDLVTNLLKQSGLKHFVVEIGGEVYAYGHKPKREQWQLGIEQPIDNPSGINPNLQMVYLQNQAISSSGNYRKFFIQDGIKYAHHIDPKTGYPAQNNLLSVSVVAADCITTDASATALLVMGLEASKIYLMQHPELQALLVYANAQGRLELYKTPGFYSLENIKKASR
jgi:thiamine biosynthesis lipoprotein